jgi:hypothetical protein
MRSLKLQGRPCDSQPIEALDRRILLSAATQAVFTQEPGSATAGTAVSPAIVVDLDSGSGTSVAGDNNLVTLSIVSGPSGAILGGQLTVAAVNGIATFSGITLTSAGTYELEASDVTDNLTADSTTFNVSNAAAKKVVFTQEPTNISAGEIMSPTITATVEDAFGNPVLNAGEVNLAVATGNISAGAGHNLSVFASNGVATFTGFTLTRSGNYTLRAKTGKLTARSTSFSVTADAAEKLVFGRQPYFGIAGDDIEPSVIVYIEDQYGNLVTSDDADVTLSLDPNSGPSDATIHGDVDVAAVDGKAVFSRVHIDDPGHYYLQASSAGLNTVTSNGFHVFGGFFGWF